MLPKNTKCQQKTRFRSKKFKSCQIPIQKLYNLSDFRWIFFTNASVFEWNVLQRVIFLRKILPWKASFWRKIEHDFEEKLIFKKQFLKKICTQKITFIFNLPRNIRLFCVLRTIFKSTVLKEIFSLKGKILDEKVFAKSMIWIKKFSSWQISNHQFFCPVRFRIECLKILKRNNLTGPPYVLFTSFSSV